MISTGTIGTHVLQWSGDAVVVWHTDVNSVDAQQDGIRWDLYPRVSAVPHARAFVIRLRRFSRRSKTVDAYARNLARYPTWFDEAPAERWLEADEGDLVAYLDDLRNGRAPGISAGPKHALPHNVVPRSAPRVARG